MLSIKTLKSSGEAVQYYTEQAKLEYYTDHDLGGGKWRGAEVLGLENGVRVEAEAMANILRGFDPKGQKITQNAGDNHRPGYDLTFSAPKSVSVLWALGDQRVQASILEAHREGVKASLDYMEKYAGITRRGKGGQRLEPVKSLIISTFDHSASRALDPQLHTHCVVANMAQRHDGSWGSIESRFIYKEKMGAGAIYRSELANQLQKSLGVEIERNKKSFEIKGISEELLSEFSKRRKEVEATLKEKGYESAKAAAIAALDTRSTKQEIPLEVIQKEWLAVGEKHGFDQSKIIGQRLHQAHKIDPNIELIPALKELTEYQSTFTEKDLRRVIATEAQGRYGHREFEQVLSGIQDHPEIIPLGRDLEGMDRFTSREIYEIERSMHEKAVKRSTEQQHSVMEFTVEKEIEKKNRQLKKQAGKNLNETGLREEQKAMIRAITLNKGAVQIAFGGAGSGKSFSLEVAANIWEKSGHNVVGLGPTGKAAQNLEVSANIQSSTVDSYLLNVERGVIKLSKNDILVLDEAGMMGSRKLNILLDRVHETKAKIVLVGDHRQLQPVEAGSAVRMLRQGLGASELVEMKRQKEAWQQEATKFFSEGKALEALNAYALKGCLSVHQGPEEARHDLVEKYTNDKQKNPLKSYLIIAETNAQVRAINEEVRSKLKQSGLLHPHGKKIDIKDQENRVHEREFTQGDRIIFTKNSRKFSVQNGLMGEVLSIKLADQGHEISVKTDHGRQVKFNSKDYQHIEHGFAVTVYKSQGDTVDKSYFLVADSSSREASYVAMSRHREGAEIYIDQSSFSEKIDWNMVKSMKEKLMKKKEISKAVVEQTAKVMNKPQAKDTSLDYKETTEETYITPKISKMAAMLKKPERSHEDKMAFTYLIATEFQGSKNRLQSPDLNQAPYQKTAEDLLKKGNIKEQEFIELANQIMGLKIGYEVKPSERMKKYQLENQQKLKPHIEKYLKNQQKQENQQEQKENLKISQKNGPKLSR